MGKWFIPITDKIRQLSKPDENGCWIWQGGLNFKGYGTMRLKGYGRSAHRNSYEAFKGSIPEGHQIDHLCRVRSCVNPDHLEAVEPRENTLRGLVAGFGVRIGGLANSERMKKTCEQMTVYFVIVLTQSSMQK